MASADVCIVGMGAAGGVMAKELASAGLSVVGFERGPELEFEDYAYKDSVRAIARREFEERVRHEPVTNRSSRGAVTRLRYTTTPANSVGGGLMIWTGSTTRFMPGDFNVYTNEVLGGVAERAGADLNGYDIPDWPIGYDDLEPYYERFEWEMGSSGEAGANPFEGPRRRGYPVPPLRHGARSALFGDACRASATIRTRPPRASSRRPTNRPRRTTSASRSAPPASTAPSATTSAATCRRRPPRHSL